VLGCNFQILTDGKKGRKAGRKCALTTARGLLL
jgi:hypothetical protein